jgi:hypothetical protein
MADFSRFSSVIWGMRLLAPVVLALAFTAIANGGGSTTVRAHGVALSVPAGWHRVASTNDRPDPRTLLVVGTAGVAPKSTQCQIAAYRVPARGAVVVVVGWKTATSGGGLMKPGRWPLKTLTSVKRRSFECFTGRGSAASLALGGRAYQVNVMVGNSTSTQHIAQALAVGRSFRLAP